jgi:hypothetical protein
MPLGGSRPMHQKRTFAVHRVVLKFSLRCLPKISQGNVMTTRKPRFRLRRCSGSLILRAERKSLDLRPHAPPLRTRKLQSPTVHAIPLLGALPKDPFQQSAVHSQTLPCMSNRPKVLGLREPTATVRSPVGGPQPVQLAYPSTIFSPHGYDDVDPARAHDVDDAFEIVGQHVQRHFGADPFQRLHLEVG